MKKLTTCLGLTGLLLLSACTSAPPAAAKEIQTERTKDLAISLMSEKGELAMGKNQFIVTFRSAASNEPVDVGSVTVSSAMAMPGMAPMTAPIELEPAGAKGQYTAKGDFAMSGAWKFEVRWDGPAGKGSASFNTNVR